MKGQRDRADGWEACCYARDKIGAGRARQRAVDNDKIDGGGFQLFEGCLGIAGLTDEIEVLLLGEQGMEPGEDDWMVIHDEEPVPSLRHHAFPSLRRRALRCRPSFRVPVGFRS